MAKVTCAVVKCSNSTYRLLQWQKKFCTIHQSHNGRGQCICEPPFKMTPFPTLSHQRDLWINNINRIEAVDRTVKDRIGGKPVEIRHKKGDKWHPMSYDRVCSDHFVDGKPSAENPFPTLNMGHDDLASNKKKRKPPVNRCTISKRTKLTYKPTVSDNTCSVGNESTSIEDNSDCVEKDDNCQECSNKETIIKKLEENFLELEGLLEAEKLKKKENIIKEESNAVEKSTFLLLNCLKSDSQVKFYTGLPSIKLFNLLYRYLYDKVKDMPYWRGRKNTVVTRVRKFTCKSPKKGGGARALTVKAELLLTLMKIRLGLLNHDIADRFGISDASVSSIFNTYVKVMAELLKFLIYWPDKISVRSNLPKPFEKLYPRTRVTIDCSEFFMDTPRDLQLQAQLYSDYKHHCTAKALIGITPRGSISFISNCWGGRASDKHITLESNILDYIDPNDQWMADRGFLIGGEILQRGGELIMPPGAKGHQQMIAAEVKKTKDVANLRIHVERAIQRMKCFRFLKNQIPLTYVPLLDQILIIVGALCNIQGPLVK